MTRRLVVLVVTFATAILVRSIGDRPIDGHDTGLAPPDRQVASPAGTAFHPVAPAVETATLLVSYSSGVRMPLLNGVHVPVSVDWPKTEPWSPIVGRILVSGVEWYRHANGRLSTSLQIEDRIEGRAVGMGLTVASEPSPANRRRD